MILLSLVLLPALGGVILGWAQRRNFAPIWEAGLGVIGVTAILWLVSRTQLDRPVTLLTDSYDSVGLPAWRWQLDSNSWWLAGIWLALTSLVILSHWQQTKNLPSILALCGAGLLVVAGDGITAVSGGMLLASMIWLSVSYAIDSTVTGQVIGQRLLFWWLALGLTLYLFLPDGVAIPVVVALATLPLMGLFPFQYWRVGNWATVSTVAPLLYGLPVLAALRLFLQQTNFAIEAGAIWLAPWGVLALAVAALTAWSARDTIVGQMALLGCSGALVWLAGSFGGAEAALAEGRGLLIAGAGLLILPHFPTPQGWQRAPHWLLAATMAGLPLTPGGYGRGLMYEGLLNSNVAGAWVLVSLLSIVPIALWFSWALGDSSADIHLPTVANNPLKSVIPWLFLLVLLPALSQISGLVDLSFNGWLSLLLPLATAATLVYVRKQRPEFGWNPARLGSGWSALQGQINEGGNLVREAIGEAGRILEGEGGLLWILFLAVLFGLARL